MSNYAAGTRVEHHNRDHLTAEGYVVLRTAGSKGFVDLIAMKPGQLLLVQCKGNGRITAADWNQLLERAAWVGAVPILASRAPSGCTERHRGHLEKPARCYTVLWHLTGPYVPRQPLIRQPAELFVTDELTAFPDGPGRTTRATCGAGDLGTALLSREGSDFEASANDRSLPVGDTP